MEAAVAPALCQAPTPQRRRGEEYGYCGGVSGYCAEHHHHCDDEEKEMGKVAVPAAMPGTTATVTRRIRRWKRWRYWLLCLAPLPV